MTNKKITKEDREAGKALEKKYMAWFKEQCLNEAIEQREMPVDFDYSFEKSDIPLWALQLAEWWAREGYTQGYGSAVHAAMKMVENPANKLVNALVIHYQEKILDWSERDADGSFAAPPQLEVMPVGIQHLH